VEFTELLRAARAVVFLGLGAAALRLWWRDRSAPAAYLAAAFGLLGSVLTVALLLPDERSGIFLVLSHVVAIGVVAFPWVLAAFAWSFEGRLPAWLWASAGSIVVLAAWLPFLPPFVAGAERTPSQLSFLTVLVVLWAVLSFAAAWRLWRAGGRQRLVRARMRLMAAGAVVMTLVLWISITWPANDALYVVAVLLSLAAAGLFVSGFAPPAPLRLWWRRESSTGWTRLQQDLIRARTPKEVASAVTPVLADLLGGGVAVVSDGGVIARSGMTESEAEAITTVADAGRPVPPNVSATPVDDSWLVVRTTAYTPLFGRYEHELIDTFALQLRMALERAELFEAHRHASREAERARDELQATLVGLAHDLRSPSVAIGAFASLLREIDDPAQRADMLEQLGSSADYLTSLVDSLLELSRLGRVEAPVQPVDLANTVRLVTRRLQVTHPGVEIRIGPGLPVVLLNPRHAEQVVDNLLRNAAEHGGRDDLTIDVTSPPSSGARLVVADNGVGVRPEDRAHVFTLFRRGATTAPGSGVGLGLVRRVVEHYGGRIRLDEAEGGGARFVIDLPAELARTDPHRVAAAATPPQGERVEQRTTDAGPTAADRATPEPAAIERVAAEPGAGDAAGAGSAAAERDAG
jgi:signal transduction histidine kinase